MCYNELGMTLIERTEKMKYKDFFSSAFISLLNEKLAVGEDAQQINPDEELKTSYVDIEEILAKMGFAVQYEDLDGISGVLKDQKTIIINNQDVEQRQRFTLAHELGHAFQGQVNAYRRQDGNAYTEKDQKDEIFANKFAAQLLMPKALVIQYAEQYIKQHDLNKDKLKAESVNEIKEYLAGQLKVSTQSMGFRIENLNLFVRAVD